MASELKIEVRCDRCQRLETRPVDEEQQRIMNGGAVDQFSATLKTASGKEHTVKIGDLCGPCENTVMNHLASIAKKVEKKSPDRTSKKS